MQQSEEANELSVGESMPAMQEDFPGHRAGEKGVGCALQPVDIEQLVRGYSSDVAKQFPNDRHDDQSIKCSPHSRAKQGRR